MPRATAGPCLGRKQFCASRSIIEDPGSRFQNGHGPRSISRRLSADTRHCSYRRNSALATQQLPEKKSSVPSKYGRVGATEAGPVQEILPNGRLVQHYATRRSNDWVLATSLAPDVEIGRQDDHVADRDVPRVCQHDDDSLGDIRLAAAPHTEPGPDLEERLDDTRNLIAR